MEILDKSRDVAPETPSSERTLPVARRAGEQVVSRLFAEAIDKAPRLTLGFLAAAGAVINTIDDIRSPK